MAAVGYVWYRYSPLLDELKEKDPEKYAEMAQEAKSLRYSAARTLFVELDEMTANDVIWLRYNKLKKRWSEDERFRLESLENQIEVRKKHREQMGEEYKNRSREYLKRSAEQKAEWLAAAWRSMDPWRKGLLLREKCAQYLDREIRANRRRVNALDLPRSAVLLGKSGAVALTPSEFCENLVSVGHDKRFVTQALGKLGEEMNYWSFLEILDELGIPADDVLAFPGRFKRLVSAQAGARSNF
ncbi:MAG: hypothetical protein ACE5GQ_09875 [Nitrospinales bacterium]